MEHRPKLLVLCGPTASGKTALGVALAQATGGEVVSADSMQIYRRMDIGTAKPTREEMGGVPHHMLDVADPAEDYSVARYVRDADACVRDILVRGRLPIVVGGTGLYIDNLIAGRDFARTSRGFQADRMAFRTPGITVRPLATEGITTADYRRTPVAPGSNMVQDLRDPSEGAHASLRRHGRETYFSDNRIPHGFGVHRRRKNRNRRRSPVRTGWK